MRLNSPKLAAMLLLVCASVCPAAYTEFYCDSVNGSNLNSGSTTSGTATYTATNGGWDSTTGVFTPASGNPSSSVNVGDFASIYNDGASVAVFVGRVTAVNSTTITVSLTAKMGTAPSTAGTGKSCKVGGAWQGPVSNQTWPLSNGNPPQGVLTNAAGDEPRFNFKNNGSYVLTTNLSSGTITGPITLEGYTTTPGDGGQATFSTSTNNVGWGINGTFVRMVGFQFSCTASGGTAANLTYGVTNGVIHRCTSNGARSHGISCTGANTVVSECEAYDNNKSNGGSAAGFFTTTGCEFDRCISHDNAGSNTSGFLWTGANTLLAFNRCIADTNGSHGFAKPSGSTSSSSVAIKGCEAYNNGGSGVFVVPPTNGITFAIENCNFVKNAAYGIEGSGSNLRNGYIRNCGFGAGTQANTSGDTTSLGNVIVEGSVSYASNVTPWTDPANGDFRVSLSTAKAAGRGTFLQTQSGYAGTVGYPDIGAAQHQDAGGGSGYPKSRIVNHAQ